MKLSTLTSQQFGEIVELIKKRKWIAAEITLIEAKLERLGGGSSVHATRKLTSRLGKRGALKEQIVRTLLDAGSKGLSLQEIAKAVGRPSSTVSVWFYTTGRKLKGLKRVKRGRYAYRA